ncbi:MAG: ABC transporter permease, partial [Christensenellales bacterium]
MRELLMLTKRNVKLFFKDKGMFLSSLITPIILLVLYMTFLAKIYKDIFVSSMPDGFVVEQGIINATVGGQLLASLLAVSCVTVAFCSNLIMVQDKVSGVKRDLMVSPIESYKVAISYYLGTLLNTMIVCLFALIAGCIYLVAVDGWYLSAVDVVLLIVDVFLLTMFGTALSSIVNTFLTTQGQMSAV